MMGGVTICIRPSKTDQLVKGFVPYTPGAQRRFTPCVMGEKMFNTRPMAKCRDADTIRRSWEKDSVYP